MEEKSICNFDKKYLNPEHLAGFENYKVSDESDFGSFPNAYFIGFTWTNVELHMILS